MLVRTSWAIYLIFMASDSGFFHVGNQFSRRHTCMDREYACFANIGLLLRAVRNWEQCDVFSSSCNVSNTHSCAYTHRHIYLYINISLKFTMQRHAYSDSKTHIIIVTIIFSFLLSMQYMQYIYIYMYAYFSDMFGLKLSFKIYIL